MDKPRALVLLLALLTLCITAGELGGQREAEAVEIRWRPSLGSFLCLYPTGTPEVWVQVEMEATKSLSFTVRCGFLGSSAISLATVSCGGRDGAGGTKLAVLHPEFGIQQWPPALQAHWESRTSISLTLEGPEGRSPSPNTTFCCKFTSFPEGSQEACGNLLLGTDQGGANEEWGIGRGGRDSGHQPPIWYVSLSLHRAPCFYSSPYSAG